MKKRFKSLAVASVFAALVALAATLPAAQRVIAQGFNIVVSAGLPTVPSIANIDDRTTGLYFATGGAGFSKHVLAGSTATANLPVLSSCGTSAALATGSTDHAGKITVGTSASNACTLTFGTTYGTAPFCLVQNLTTGAAANVYSVSATAITWSSALADSTVLMYACIGVGGT